MMAASQEEIPPPLVDTDEAQCADGRTEAAVSKVLEDDNLLIEILLCLGFPTTLVRAALVCKRWYNHASDRGFLKNFRKRHPPRLLGFYIDEQATFSSELNPLPYFVPMPSQPLELAAVVRRVAGYSFGNLSIRYCRNGHIFTRSYQGGKFQHGLHRPLCPEEGMHIVLPEPTSKDPFEVLLGDILSKEDTCGGLSYMYLLAEWTNEETKLSVYVLQDGAWGMRPIATHQIATPLILQSLCAATAALFGDKIYIANSLSSNILVFDFTASTLSRIPLPPEVKYHYSTSTLSQADNASGIYLTHVHGKEFQLHIWLHKGDNWLLVHTICLHEMCANLGLLDHTLEDEDEDTDIPHVCHVGDNAEFVFLKMCGCTLYLDVTRKTMQKVHEMAEKDQSFHVYPFMMTWPPIFPALKDDSARNSM